jgi:hypothetical protein
MEAVQREHDRIVKKTKGSQGIKNVQSTIDLLQSARDAIAAGRYSIDIPALCFADDIGYPIDPTSASVTLAKLQTPVKSSFDSINDSLKDTHSGLNKYTKSLDKVHATSIRSKAPMKSDLTYEIAFQRSTASYYRTRCSLLARNPNQPGHRHASPSRRTVQRGIRLP